MMCGRLLRPSMEEHPGLVSRWSEGLFQKVLSAYGRSLDWSLRHQRFVLLVGAAAESEDLVDNVLRALPRLFYFLYILPSAIVPAQPCECHLGIA